MNVGLGRLHKDLKQNGPDAQVAPAFAASTLLPVCGVADEIIELLAQDIGFIGGLGNRPPFWFNLWGHRITSVLT
ncbi:MAG: hypothetical protein ACLP59_21940 [Bryobacteraceae bacterium]